MEVDETRSFEIDKKVKKNCKLPGPQIVEIQIKKERSEFMQLTKFRMVNPDLAPAEAFINCEDGFVDYLKTKGPAADCGIGKILMQLCLNEDEIHNVKRKDENRALQKLKDYIDDCKKKASCSQNDKLIKKLGNTKKWAKSHCKKLIYLEMRADPRTQAHLYFKSTIASGYTQMFMITEELDDTPSTWDFYPKEGPCPVEMLQKRYSDDGYMINGQEIIEVLGMNWFFCQPKTPIKLPKCIVM